MCGIVGYWNRDGRVASEVILERMIERIQHRGPDDKGTWTQKGIGLGHARLSILDLSRRGHQPFVTADGTGILSYNGEIYNFRQLRAELEQAGVRFKSTTDTEVLLYGLHVWGPEQAVGRFNGMFAFAYYDRRTETLWLGRDKLGIKPLYVAQTGNAIVFASEIKALFEHPDVPVRPNLHALTTHIICQRLIGKWTTFEDVESVKPGSLLKITAARSEEIVYFDILRDLQVDRILEASQTSFPGAVAKFENYFSESINAHLISDAPLAAMCSGGLDSSLMVAFAKRFKKDLVAYVADIKEVKTSEGQKAKRVCDHLGIELRQIPVDRETFLKLWPLSTYHNDEPNFFPQNIPFMEVARAASRDGFKVMLTGEGSDELFGGYAWHVEAYRMWRMRGIHSKLIPNTRATRFLGRFFDKLRPLDLNQLEKLPFAHLSKTLWDIRSACAIDGAQRFLNEAALFRKLEKIKPVEERAFLTASFADFYCQLPTLLWSNDKMGMAHSIEARVPFLENRLIDFGLHLPCVYKYRGGVTKRIVKTAAEKYLPREIVHARKIGFGVAASIWRSPASLLKKGVLSELLQWGKQEAEAIYDLVLTDDSLVYHLLSAELWARIYLRGESVSDLSERLLKASAEASPADRLPRPHAYA